MTNRLLRNAFVKISKGLTRSACRPQAQLERQVKTVTQQCNEMQLRLDEANRTVNDLNNSRQKLERTKVELEEKLDRAERLISGLTKAKSALATQAEDATRRADHENRVIYKIDANSS